MSTSAPRPAGVVIVAVLMLIVGVVSLLSGILSLIGAAQVTSVVVEGATLNQPALYLVGGWAIVVGVLDILLAIGILRASRVARMIVTIVQVLAIISGVIGLFNGSVPWTSVYTVVVPIVIVLMLWNGQRVKDFFAKR